MLAPGSAALCAMGKTGRKSAETTHQHSHIHGGTDFFYDNEQSIQQDQLARSQVRGTVDYTGRGGEGSHSDRWGGETQTTW